MNALERESKYFFHTYKRIPLEIERGKGVYLYTKDGKRYLDMFAGLAVNALGYGHPKVLKAIEEQSRKYIHLSNYYLQEPQIQLAELLVKYSGYPKVFFSNSGTEAIEGAIKIARKWGSKRGKTEILSFSNAFHGRTMGALSIMDRPKYRDGYAPFLPNCRIVEFNNLKVLHSAINNSTLAVVLEFIQGEGGICLASPDLVEKLKNLKAKYGFLIIADEIQSGLGRTGRLFGFQHYDVQPDIVVIAKPLGGGLPLGAILGGAIVADVLQPGVHGTTFGGNPVACAAGVVVLQEIMENGLINNANQMGQILKSKLLEVKKEFPTLVRDVRGFGLMVGMELTRECDSIVAAVREQGVLVNCTNQNVVRFLPSLIINEQHIEETIRVLREAFKSSTKA
ncbi:MAG: aspartate aminotransferase family protein [Acidobacteriota bacterium]